MRTGRRSAQQAMIPAAEAMHGVLQPSRGTRTPRSKLGEECGGEKGEEFLVRKGGRIRMGRLREADGPLKL